MALPLVPTLPFVPSTSTIPASVLNAWRSFFPACLDADGGGDYANTSLIRFTSGSAGWEFQGPVAIRRTAVENGPAEVYASGSFLLKSDVTFAGTITTTEPLHVWTTPSRPLIITGGLIQLTSDLVATADPGNLVLSLEINPGTGSETVVSGTTDSWGGTTYSVGSPSANKVIFGLASGERGQLFPGGFTADQQAASGAAGGANTFAALAGPVNGYWGKSMDLIVAPLNVPITFTSLAFRVYLYGFML